MPASSREKRIYHTRHQEPHQPVPAHTVVLGLHAGQGQHDRQHKGHVDDIAAKHIAKRDLRHAFQRGMHGHE